MDSGANKGLTKHRHLLKAYRRIKKIPVGGIGENGAACYIIGVGYFDLKTADGSYISCKMYHAPDCSVTVISPNAIVRGSKGKYTSWSQTSHVVEGMAKIEFFNTMDPLIPTDVVDMSIRNDLWYTQQSYKRLLYDANPTEIYLADGDLDVDEAQTSTDKIFVGKLSAEATYELWHQRAIHSGQNVLEALPRCVDGVPKNLGQCRHGLYKCACCQSAKSTNCSGNPEEEVKATVPCERLHMDFGFIKAVDNESDDKISNLIRSYDGYNSYLLIIDKKTRYIWIFLSESKSPPVATVDKFFMKHGIPQDKRGGLNLVVRTDQGGELSNNERFQKILALHGYALETTAAGSSSQNGLAERPNETIGSSLRAMLLGAGLADKFWSDALVHAIFVKNRLPHAAFRYNSTPYTEMTGMKPNLEKLRVFGCPVTVHKPG